MGAGTAQLPSLALHKSPINPGLFECHVSLSQELFSSWHDETTHLSSKESSRLNIRGLNTTGSTYQSLCRFQHLAPNLDHFNFMDLKVLMNVRWIYLFHASADFIYVFFFKNRKYQFYMSFVLVYYALRVGARSNEIKYLFK